MNLQDIATNSLRKGLIEYDQRRGWRGVIDNKKILDNWNKNLDEHFLEKSLGWKIAIIKKINEFSLDIETIDKKEGKINYEGLSWTKTKTDAFK